MYQIDIDFCLLFFRIRFMNKTIILRKKEKKANKPLGIWWDHITQYDDNDNIIANVNTKKKKNLIVLSYPALISGLLANESIFNGGILFHALGEGQASWDINLPPPQYTDVFLTNEYYRKAPDSITYQDQNGDPVISVTNARSILIKTTFDRETAGHPSNGKFIRTHGLVGGNATSSINTGLFVDVINHYPIYKSEKIKLVRFIELYFG